MADYWNDGTELYHHGILGQKWGVRNGPPYPLSDEDHNAAERKAGWKKSLNNGSKKEGKTRLNKEEQLKALSDYIYDSNRKNGVNISRAEAEESAKSLVKLNNTAKAILAAGVLAGGAFAAYTLLKRDPYSGDFTVPKGATLFRVQPMEYEDLPKDFFYATPDENDAIVYKGFWGAQQNIFGMNLGYKNALKIGVNDDVKVAGMEAARKAFDSLIADREFIAAGGSRFGGLEAFLRDAPLEKNNTTPFIMFQRKLQELGYGGVIDYNDKFGQGYAGYVNAPVIFFNQKADTGINFAIKTIEQLDGAKVAKYKGQALRIINNNPAFKKKMIKEFAPQIALGSFAASGLLVATESTKRQAREQAIIIRDGR